MGRSVEACSVIAVYGRVMAARTTIERETFAGEVIRPGDPGYDDARAVYNGMHDRRPALIVRAAGIDDVRSAIRLAAAHDLPLAVRGGGHSVAGFSTCDDGLVLDLGGMRGIAVDPERGVVRTEAGCTWGELNDATHSFGLATTGGVVSTTGVAGLTLGGGIGFLARRCGLACDNLLAAEMVTAGGQLLRCSADENDELFWALRGGGGNFGVVTSFEYRLHPIGQVIAGPFVYPLEGDVVRRYDRIVRDAPEELGLVLALALAPPFPFLPSEWHLQPVAIALACWTGAPEDADDALRPLVELGTVIGQGTAPMPYPVVNTLFDELLPKGLRHYWKSVFVADIAEGTIERHVEHARRVPTLESGTFFFPLDGACHRVGADESAFGFRDARFNVGVFGTWPDPADDEPNITWVREYYEAIRHSSLGGGYVNFSSHDDQGRAPEMYRGNHDRLARVKRDYDPGNVFRLNQNVEPADA
jgi:FAD/FMN-containing dehydrogenase